MIPTYDSALQKASADLAAAIQERDRWNLEVARLTHLVVSLSAAAGVAPLARTKKGETVGFTEVVLAVVTRSPQAMSAQDVRNAMVAFGHDLSSYSNPLAHIHQTLKRLATQGRIVEVDGAYKRTALYETLLKAVAPEIQRGKRK